MIAEPTYRRILSGEGMPWAAPLRGLLTVASWGYAAAVRARNAHYDFHGPRFRSAVPVISVGNVTVGGTGKTPLTIDLLRRLQIRGRKPAVVSRGYGAHTGSSNDEEALIRRGCPGVICVSSSNRSRACERATEEYGADVIVLDDGFQHRQVARDLDIVLIDATCPFGYDCLLPRGLLREPVSSLSRADAVVLTRCDQALDGTIDEIKKRIQEFAPQAEALSCHHHVTGVERLDGVQEGGDLKGRRVVLFAALGNPAAFARTAVSIGAEVVGTAWFPDHHAYTIRDLEALRRPGRFPPHDMLVTTEKDAVKLAALPGIDPASVWVVRVVIRFADSDSRILDELLSRVEVARP